MKGNDHDQDPERQARLQLQPQDGRLPMQSLHLPQLRLLIERAAPATARPDLPQPPPSSAAVQLCCQTGWLSPVS